MYHGVNQQAPLPSYAYSKTPFDDDYNPQHYSGSTNPFEEVPKRDVIHRIKDGDTLMSLSLTYGVAIPVIRKANGLTSDEIYYLGEIKIPNPKNHVYPEPPNPEKDIKQNQSTARQAFKNRTGEQDPNIIEKYLSRAAFNFYDAVDSYEKDKHIISKQKIAISTLKGRLEKDDRDDRIAEFYLQSNAWNVTAAYQNYKEDMNSEKGNKFIYPHGEKGYQPVPQVAPAHYTYNPSHSLSNPNYSVEGQPHNRFNYPAK